MPDLGQGQVYKFVKDVDLSDKGLQDDFVTTPVPLGGSGATVLNTTAQNIVGAINEVNLLHSAAEKEILTISTPGQTAFTLSETPSGDAAFGLFLNGQMKTLSVDYSRSGTSLTWLDPDGLTLETADELKAWYDFSAPEFLSPWQVSGSSVVLDNVDNRVHISSQVAPLKGGLQFNSSDVITDTSNSDKSNSILSNKLITEYGSKVFAQENFLISAANPWTNAFQGNATGNGADHIVIWDSVTANLNNDYDTSTGKFTCIRDGFFEWGGFLIISGLTSSHTDLRIRVHIDDGVLPAYYHAVNRFNPWPISVSGVLNVPFCWKGVHTTSTEIWISLQVLGGTKVINIDGASYSRVIFQGKYSTI